MASTSTSAPRTIRDFFGAKAKSASSPTMTSCPACGVRLPLRDINRHLDSPQECRPEDTVVKQAEEQVRQEQAGGGEDKGQQDLFGDSDDEYRDVCNGDRSLDGSPARLRKSYSFEACAPRHFSPAPASSPCSSVSSSQPTPERFRASRSISRTPNKFSGVKEMSRNGSIKLSPSPRRRRARGSKTSPLPVGGNNSTKDDKAKKSLFSGDEAFSEGPHVPLTQSKRSDPDHVPYYVVNFEHVLRCVLDETDDGETLLDAADWATVRAYRELSLDARRLFVRLFQRRHAWLQRGQVKYDEVADTDAALKDLVGAGLLMDGDKLEDLDVLLKLLPAPEVKAIAKEMNLASGFARNKSDLVEDLMKHSRRKSIMFFKSGDGGGGGNPIEKKLNAKARGRLGVCYKLEEEPRKLFLRVLSLFSLSNFWDERESGEKGQPQQLTTILLVNQGKMTFPNYDIRRSARLFRCKNDLLDFEEACREEARMSEAFDKKDWEEALEVYKTAREMFETVMKHDDTISHVRQLPVFLRRFTRGAVLAYVVNRGVEVLERAKRHQDAVDTLRMLIEQDLYLPLYQGHWYERLTLDLDQHLKRPGESLEEVRNGMNDKEVRKAKRLALVQRALMIKNRKILGGKFDKQVEELESRSDWSPAGETPSETIQGRLMPKEQTGGKTVFVIEQDGEDGEERESLLCSVEEFCREYYRKEKGLKQGLHAEGSVVGTILAVMFWEVLYETSLPDVFRSPNQAAPLDLGSDDFYQNRKGAIDARLLQVSSMTRDEMGREAEDCWERHHGVVSLAHWDLFQDAAHLSGLVKCLTGQQVAGICGRMLKDHRHTRSGFPDLTLWDPEGGRCEVVEVKGPGDRLSNKQILWIEFLNSLGVRSYVCHVEAVGGKRLSRSPAKRRRRTGTPSPKKNAPAAAAAARGEGVSPYDGSSSTAGGKKRGRNASNAADTSRSKKSKRGKKTETRQPSPSSTSKTNSVSDDDFM